MGLLLSGAQILNKDFSGVSPLDILIEQGVFSEISENINPDGHQVINLEGLYAAPGLVDIHCHLREPGFEYKENIESGTASAVAGGFTTLCAMPNTDPVIDNKAVAGYIARRGAESGLARVHPIGAITKRQKGAELAEMEDMQREGIVAVSDDGHAVASSALMRRAMIYAKSLNLPVIAHSEDINLVDGGVMNEGFVSARLGLRGIPAEAEEVCIARDVILAEHTGVRLHIAHVSTAGSVEIIRQAKARGVSVTCETCPHYFSLTEAACDNFNTLAKVNPPLRTEVDRQAIIQGLIDGTIDAIATDHAPHHADEKNIEFNLAASGMIGFETALALGITYLVHPGHLSLETLLYKMTAAPADILSLPAGRIEIGASADLVIFDPNAQWTVDVTTFASKSKNSPFGGISLSGRVEKTIYRGNLVFERK